MCGVAYDIREREQRGADLGSGGLWLASEDVEAYAKFLFRSELEERVLIDELRASCVDQHGVVGEELQDLAIDDAARQVGKGQMQGEDVGSRRELLQRACKDHVGFLRALRGQGARPGVGDEAEGADAGHHLASDGSETGNSDPFAEQALCFG